MTAYYNEHDPYAAQWLRNLIAAGHIAPGDVDTRSIEDVTPNDIKGYTQCHWFAGIGVWSYALRRAGWPDDRQVWTGSCPCQPFSVAGKGDGFADERHLWPAFHWLIEQCGPRVVFGEQVASKDGYAWLDLVQNDLEGTGYTCGAVVAPAAGFGAPHQRHRMYWVADSNDERSQGREFGRDRTAERVTGSRGVAGGLADTKDNSQRESRPCDGSESTARRHGVSSGLADAADFGQYGRGSSEAGNGGTARVESERLRDVSGLADAEHNGPSSTERSGHVPRMEQQEGRASSVREPSASGSPVRGFWSAADWIYCRDEKYRPVEPGTFPLAHGAPARVGRLRAYGNAICAIQAEEFIKAYLAVRP